MIKGLLTIALLSTFVVSLGQDISGIWQGVQKEDGTVRYWPYSFALTQSGSQISGYSRQVAGGTNAYSRQQIEGTFVNNILKFDETKFLDQINPPGGYWCLANGVELKYDPIEEKLSGTYQADNCGDSGPGSFEMYRLVFKSPNNYCNGRPINLKVTGNDIRWYADINKQKLLNRGNEFSPNITQTTTFYVTQTLYNTESPALPVEIKVGNLVLKTEVTDMPCRDINGKIEIAVSGNIGKVEYSMDRVNFQTSNVFSVTAGSYKILARDENGCEATTDATVGSANPVINSVTGSPENCTNKDGSIQVEAFIAVANTPVMYSLDAVNFQISNTFSKLSAGSYNITIKDKNGCTAFTNANVKNAGPPEFNNDLKVIPESCGKQNGSASVSVLDNPSVSFSLNDGPTQSSGNFSNLAAGKYVISCFEVEGCSSLVSFEVPKVGMPSITDIQTTETGCGAEDGTVTIYAKAEGKLQYSIDGKTFKDNSIFENLQSGTYTAYIQDNASCIVSQVFEIPDNSAPPIDLEDLTISNPICGEANGRVEAQSRSIRYDLIYNLNGQDFGTISSFANLPEGAYTFTVKAIRQSDHKECWIETRNFVLQENCPVYIPDAFTPNSDGKNETFKLAARNLTDLVIRKFMVYDRWGQVIFMKANVPADQFEWDGVSGDKTVPAGAYPYSLLIESKSGKELSFKRTVLIIR